MTIFLAQPHTITTPDNTRVNDGVSGGVSGGVNQLLEFIRSNPGEKSSAIKIAMGQSQRTIERWLKRLKDKEKIEFIGAPKTGGYFVKQS